MKRNVVFARIIAPEKWKKSPGRENLEPFDTQQLRDISLHSGFVASIPTISAIS